MTSAANAAFVLEITDLPTCKNLTIAKKYEHPDSVFGCAWNPKKLEFITGCQDGLVRLFDISSDTQ